jgi:coenzyme F420-reducing hydrogenase delta subunit
MNALSNQQDTSSTTLTGGTPSVTIFVCVNGARPGVSPTSGVRSAPSRLGHAWPFSVDQVMVPCAGKLQPEHLLKAFEGGADLVCVLACGGDNCHYLEGSRRAQRRVEYVRRLLDEVGVGGERLLMANLPGSAREDMAAAGGEPALLAGAREKEVADRLTDISRQIAGKLQALGLSPLARSRRST